MDGLEKVNKKIDCKYGNKCYQMNPQHHAKYKHPAKNDDKIEMPVEAVPVPKKAKFEKFSTDLKNKGSSYNEVEKDFNKDQRKAVEEENKENAESDEDLLLLDSPIDLKENLKQKFLVEFPDDFYDLWEFANTLNPKNPQDALNAAELYLVGPFDVLSGKLKGKKNAAEFLCHYRYYYDAPEFQTVLRGSSDDFHIGYYRDSPDEAPVFLGSSCASKKGIITCLADNVFGAICSYITTYIKMTTPFEKTTLQKLLKSVEAFAKDHSYSLDAKSGKIKARNKKIVAKTFHGAGIVVPIDKENDVGYREIPETNANLRRMFKRIQDSVGDAKSKAFEDLQELITNTNFANDEGDFGMGLELGIDLFIYGGSDFHLPILHLLGVAYDLLNRHQFTTILKAHLKRRREDGPYIMN